MRLKRSAHCRWSSHLLCQDGAAINCRCWCHGHPSKFDNLPATYRTCVCGFEAESEAVWDFHHRADHNNVTGYRIGIDEWVIDLGDDVLLPFYDQDSWRDACKELGLGDPSDPREWVS